MIDLIITGCITPDEGVPYVAIQNPEVRKREYLETLEWAINQVDVDNIIFVDTSDYKFDEEWETKFISCKEKGIKSIELMSFKANQNEVNNRGKGYGEGEAIQYAINHSQLIDVEKDTLIKITGRLRIKNINQIIHGIRDYHMIIINLNYPYHNMLDTRLFILPFKMYRQFFEELYYNVDDCNWICLEHLFYRSVRDNNIPISCTCRYPQFVGKSGSTGKDYGNNRLYKEMDWLCRLKVYNYHICMRVLHFVEKIKCGISK